jgi:Plant transposon protein
MVAFSKCFDINGDLNLDEYYSYRRKRRLEEDDEEDDEENDEEKGKKRQFKHRNYVGYNPNDALTSEWYRRYVSEVNQPKNKKHLDRFRRRFRMPYSSFVELVKEARDEDWFPTYEKCNALGQKGVPLEIFVLGSLRYLGRGWTFDDISESTGVSEEAHRLFFNFFVKACRANLYPKWVKRPTTEEEVSDCMAEFVEAGFNGCIGSADVTHIILEKCHARLKNQNLGGKDSHTTRAFQLVVNHRRQIIASTVGFPGRWNDQTVVRFDDFITDIQRGYYLEDNEFVLLNTKGEEVKYNGAWILVDGGYPNWTTLVCPFKDTSSIMEQRWSRWAESMRKDVECAFGIMKGNCDNLINIVRLL